MRESAISIHAVQCFTLLHGDFITILLLPSFIYRINYEQENQIFSHAILNIFILAGNCDCWTEVFIKEYNAVTGVVSPMPKARGGKYGH